MHIHMTGIRCQHSLTALQHRRDHYCIGLCPSYSKEYASFRTFTGCPDLLCSADTVRIVLISRHLFQIGFCKPLQDLLMGSLQIITCK